MRKNYVLWLDESGKFENEQLAKKNKRKPSMIGGFLLEKKSAKTIDFDALILAEKNHAMDLDYLDKRDYVLPVLERMRDEYSGRQVFFENAEYAEEDSNRQLYLRIMAEGLVQLMQTLNAEHESVTLEVLIARRQDMTAHMSRRRIQEPEYVQVLEKCIESKKKERRIRLHKSSRLKIDVQPAHENPCLQLADFACNTRLTRDSMAFQDVKERVAGLYLDAYIFSLNEISSENYINRCLVQGHFADAIMELYTTLDTLNRKKYLKRIAQRMKNTAYRLVKSQMKQLNTDLVSYLAKEDDFEVGEKILKRMEAELIPCLESFNLPYQKLYFTLLIQLSDMFLREGDLISARRTLETCRNLQKSLGDCLEEVFSHYQLQEKEALLAINEFDFENGSRIMREACHSFQTILEAVEQDEFLRLRFSDIRSEYLGDALCMLLYAEMFLQRTYPERYPKLCELSDLALKQYPDEEGELERHRQYRSRIEAEQGNYRSALLWLILAKTERLEGNGVPSEDYPISDDIIYRFLEMVCNTEPKISCQYYLMYYLLIMAEAANVGDPFADQMHQILLKQERLCSISELREEPENPDYLEINIKSVQREISGISYHPMEVVFWKYASYLMKKDRLEAALSYYKKAALICFKYKNYNQLYITGIGIETERIYCMYCAGKKTFAEKAFTELLLRVNELLKTPLSEVTLTFVRSMKELLEASQLRTADPHPEKLWEASRKITY